MAFDSFPPRPHHHRPPSRTPELGPRQTGPAGEVGEGPAEGDEVDGKMCCTSEVNEAGAVDREPTSLTGSVAGSRGLWCRGP